MEDNMNKIIEILQPVKDPEIGYSIVDMGLILESEEVGGTVNIKMALTAPGCPYAPQMISDVENTLKEAGYDNINLDIVDDIWSPEMMSDDLKLELGYPI